MGVEREVERYGEEEDQPDVFETLLRQAGAKNTAAPPPVMGSLTDDQKERIKREKREREQREEEEKLRRDEGNSALDEEEELEREVNSELMISASAASEWGDAENVRRDNSEVEKIVGSETSENVPVEAGEELMNLDEMMDEME